MYYEFFIALMPDFKFRRWPVTLVSLNFQSFGKGLKEGSQAHCYTRIDVSADVIKVVAKTARRIGTMLKRAQRKALDVLNTLGLSNSVMRLIEKRNHVDWWIKYAGMVLTIIVLIVFWRWTT
ncbi:uncharacterized protein LOC111374019 [Olea europaea var. sylvestris]|uniref:uncharacterized protein LOC111374019 n=1 Tax=Olea europaea var. sylvestris TaxID=158386 RepID=UPI000C1D73F6|nr:uncharacterized protein LOC111374019 [Olea europaea var. sylvestris]